MRQMLRNNRGSVAFATAVALVPLVGFVALGTEAGSWYVIRQHAQNTADSAALAGALAIVNGDAQPDFGTLNGFASSNVVATTGTYSSGTFTAGGTPLNAVQAVVTQCQTQSLSLVVYTGSCNGTAKSVMIKAQAVASIEQPAKLPCALALSGPVTFQDAAVTINAPNCGIASNATPVGFDFKVDPKTLTVGSMSTAGSCSGSTSFCPSVQTYVPPVTDPYSALTTAINSLSLSKCKGSMFPLQSYATGQCANDNVTINSATTISTSGVYFFSGGLSLGGSGSLTTAAGVTATIIILPVSGNKPALKMAGGSTFNVSAPTTAPSSTAIPSALSSVASLGLLTDLAIFDPETSPQITGTSTMIGSGVFYLPNAALNYQGTSNSSASTCTEVIAASINFSGTPSFDNSGCPDNIRPKSKIVALVQ